MIGNISLPVKKSGAPLYVWLKAYRLRGHKHPILAIDGETTVYLYESPGDTAENVFFRFIRRNPNKYLACFPEIAWPFINRYAPNARRKIASYGHVSLDDK